MNNDNLDTHVLYLYTNGLTEEQIVESICYGIHKYEIENNVNVESIFRLNMVKNEDEESLGFAWLYVSNSTLYFLLSNHNPDSTERIILVDVENYQLPTETFEELYQKEFDKEAVKYSEDAWMREILKEEIKCKIEKMFEIPKIERKLPPLIHLKPMIVISTEDRENEVIDRENEVVDRENEVVDGECVQDGENQNNTFRDRNEELFMKKAIPTISRGKLAYPSERYTYCELKNAHYVTVENFMNEKFLYELFRPYVSDKSNTFYPKIFFQTRKIKNENDEDRQIKTVFIRFDSNTLDGLVAFTMLRKIVLHVKEDDESMPQIKHYAFNFSQNKK